MKTHTLFRVSFLRLPYASLFFGAVALAFAFSRTTSAGDAPKRSAELHVLDRFVGTWDEKTQTMTFKGTYPDGGKLNIKHRFNDQRNAESSGTISSPLGKVLLELSNRQARREK